jgi:putative ABC transport system permease protein
VFQTPLRAALTVLGLAIGIGAIVAVMAIGQAGQAEVESQLSRIGVGRAWIRPAQGEDRALASEDAQLVRAAARAQDAAVSAVAYRAAPLRYRDAQAHALLVGCEPDLAVIEGLRVAAGRFLRADDGRDLRAVAVLEDRMAARLFGTVDPLGKQVDLDGRRLKVVGVAGTGRGGEVSVAKPVQEERVWVPLSTFQSLYGARVDEIALSVFASADPEQAGAAGAGALAARYGGQYQATTYRAEMQAARSILRIFLLVMSCVAVICMAVGGIGVMNIMLVSVRERRYEIGMLKALGATPIVICIQFLLEALVYALLGGALGLLSGALLSAGAAQTIRIAIPVTRGTALAALSFACGIGVFFGVYPALRAARMQPVDALRAEHEG